MMVIKYQNTWGTYERKTTFEPIKNCNTCKYRRNNKIKCVKCESFSNYDMVTETMRKMGGLDRVVKGYMSSEAIRLIASMFGVTYMEAKEHYWKWRREYVKNGEW